MNNNQGYNGGGPLFDNDFNNPNNIGTTQNNNPYNQNNGMNNNQGYGASGPLFANDFNNMNNIANPYNSPYNQNNFSNMNQPDMPPELGEIKPLNEATISEAPTMDVLGPISVPNQDINLMQDPIEAYEQNGFPPVNNMEFNNGINQYNNYNSNIPNNYTMPQNIPQNNFQSMSPYQNYQYPTEQPYMPNMNAPTNYSVNMSVPSQNNYDFNGLNNMPMNNNGYEVPNNNYGVPNLNPQIPGMPYGTNYPNEEVRTSYFKNENDTSLSNLPPMSSDILNASFGKEQNYGTPSNISYDMPSINMENDNQYLNNDILSGLPPMSSDILNASFNRDVKDNLETNISYDIPPVDVESKFEPSYLNSEDMVSSMPIDLDKSLNNSDNKEDGISSDETEMDNEEKNDIDISLLTEKEEAKEDEEKLEKPYEIINDKLENNDLLDMRLDESYEEPDSLEIMDVDGDDEDSLSVSGLDDKVKANLDKIKKLAEEIKASGDKIEIEEFDFDGMYQIIIKLEK